MVSISRCNRQGKVSAGTLVGLPVRLCACWPTRNVEHGVRYCTEQHITRRVRLLASAFRNPCRTCCRAPCAATGGSDGFLLNVLGGCLRLAQPFTAGWLDLYRAGGGGDPTAAAAGAAPRKFADLFERHLRPGYYASQKHRVGDLSGAVNLTGEGLGWRTGCDGAGAGRGRTPACRGGTRTVGRQRVVACASQSCTLVACHIVYRDGWGALY